MTMRAELDRLAMRARPPGSPLMHQNWENLLFMHWPTDPAAMRSLIPEPLEIDTYEDKAWIGITPFNLTGLRLENLPAVPGLESFLELNVRTYVHYKGMPGIWFFSLDASKLIPAIAARTLFTLPYYKARMQFTHDGQEFRFECERTVSRPASFRAHWRTGARLREPHKDSLAFFLVERYAFFAHDDRGLSITQVYHHPWILDEATVLKHGSTMIKTLGIPEPTSEPLAHYSRFMNVDVWPPSVI